MLIAQRLRTLLALAVLALLLFGPGMNPSWPPVERLEQALYDWRMRLNQRSDVDPRVVIVDIDERSLNAEGRWPWPRERLADLVERLFDDYGITLLAFDMVFAESDRLLNLARLDEALQGPFEVLATPIADLLERFDPDLRFADSLRERPVVMGFAFTAAGEPRTGGLPAPLPTAADAHLTGSLPHPAGYIANLPLLQESALAGGFFDNPLVDSDGIFRRVPLLQNHQGALYPSLSLAVMQQLFGAEQLRLTGAPAPGSLEHLDLDGLRIPVDAEGAALIPYRGPQGSFPYLSASKVLNGEAPAELLEGAIVLLGTSAAGLLDLRATPVQSTYPGVEVHANLIAGMLDERLLHRPDYMRGANLLQCLLLGLLMVFTPPRLGALRTGLFSVLLGALALGSNLLLWRQAGHVLPLAPPLLVLLVLLPLQLLAGYMIESRRHSQLAGLFGQYIPPELVREMGQREGDFGLGGESREMTVLFSDIRGFTSLSEQLSPQELTRLMDAYLSPMTNVIHRHRGTIDKYIGDAVMAFWGAPLEDPAHARHALQGALAMLDELASINRHLADQGLPRLEIGIGLNSGEMSVGNMGSRFRMAYTVLGDAVNLGSRLEGLTKEYGVALIVGEEVVKRAPEHPFRLLDRVRVKGKQQPVAIYEPLAAQLETDQTAHWLTRHHQALEDYREGRWAQAQQQFQELLDSPLGAGPYHCYLQRLEQLLTAPPPPNWDGVWTLDHK